MLTRHHGLVALLLAAPPALSQQVRFSLEAGSASVGTPDSGGTLIEPSSILGTYHQPSGLAPVPLPVTTLVGPDFGVPSPADVDAFSHGQDAVPAGAIPPGRLWFSVDRLSPGGAPTPWASVRTETPEAASDLFLGADGLPSLPAAPGAGRHTVVMDGNGADHPLSGHQRPGLGIAEAGDAVDGLDRLNLAGATPSTVYFSLDPAAALPLGVAPADVLVSTGGAPFDYLTAPQLGLDTGGESSDDIDALCVWDDGNQVYDSPTQRGPSQDPYLWGPGEGDLVLFSVARGSAVLGKPDSHFGLPIMPGDVLTVPEPGSAISGFPAIVVAAERLGLITDRPGLVSMDDLDALDLTGPVPLYDCNGNGLEDGVEIVAGAVSDLDRNGYPDGCEAVVSYCTAGTSAWGCVATLSASDFASATQPSGFQVTASSVNGDVSGLLFFGTASSVTPWGSTSSFKCVAPPTRRTPLLTSSGVAGGCGDMGLDLNALWCPLGCPKPGANPGVGATVYLQAWYRDPMAAGFTKTAMSDALQFNVLP